MATSSIWKIIVWERVNQVGMWCPYPGEVCQLLEQSFKKNESTVCLGAADFSMKIYSVNLKDLMQISKKTGKKSPVRRQLYEDGTAVARNIMWQWRGDEHNTWYCFSTDVVNYIESSYKEGQDVLDLSQKFPNYNYKIEFRKMQQKNKHTKYQRPIRRICISPFPVEKFSQDNTCEVSSSSEMPFESKTNDTFDHCAKSEKMNTESSVVKINKMPLIKQVSSLWNKLIKAEECNSEGATNHSVDSSSKKKAKQSKWNKNADKNGALSSMSSSNWGTDNCDLPSESNKFAIVNGKPWTCSWPPHTPQSQIKPVPAINPLPQNKKRGGKKNALSETPDVESSETKVLEQFTEEVLLLPSDSAESQVCNICYEALCNGSSYDDDTTLVKLLICSHIFHKSCLKAMYQSGPKDEHIRCPTCKTIHGIKCGIQPPGKMIYHVLPYSLPGYQECDTIRIIYDIPSGTQGPEHPNPGRSYTARGFPRHCYLPDNEMGRKVLRLLVTAWERRLIFTIGSSSTTGEENTVTWNEIHHKTEFGCNRHGHGFPDPNYFDNIILELEAQGVTEKTYTWYPA